MIKLQETRNIHHAELTPDRLAGIYSMERFGISASKDTIGFIINVKEPFGGENISLFFIEIGDARIDISKRCQGVVNNGGNSEYFRISYMGGIGSIIERGCIEITPIDFIH